MFRKKLENIINRTHPNIKSGNVMIDTKDRDWLISMVKNLLVEVEFLEKKNYELLEKTK